MKKGFTLMELLVVVLVLGVLAAVAVPKMSRVLETRKTTEAEEIFSAVRNEQERRCMTGKNYQTVEEKIPVLSSSTKSGNYNYSLGSLGISAESNSKDYTLKMLTYKEGKICCEGEYCESLNKDYPNCSSLVLAQDECAGDLSCTEEPDQEKCCSNVQRWDGSQCVNLTPCELNPSTNTCCDASTQEWTGTECRNLTACELNPSTQTCCDASKQKWEGSQCVNLTPCELNPSTQTCCDDPTTQEWDGESCVSSCKDCSCSSYAANHPCECDSSYATANPCECDTDYQSKNALECQCKKNITDECYNYEWDVVNIEKYSANAPCKTYPSSSSTPHDRTRVWEVEQGLDVRENECNSETLGVTSVIVCTDCYRWLNPRKQACYALGRKTYTCSRTLKDFSSKTTTSGGGYTRV